MTFSVRFLICNIFITMLLGCILFFKKAFKKHITKNVQHRLWYIFVFTLFLPFMPYKVFSPEKLLLQIQQIFSQSATRSASILQKNTTASLSTLDLGLSDFPTAAVSSNSILNTVLWGIWITGMILTSSFFIYTVIKIYLLRKNAYPITALTEPDLYHQYADCLTKLHIRRNVRLYASCSLSSPVSYGYFHPTVIIPQDLDIVLSEKDIHFIFLHELQHYKRKDMFLNLLVCLLQIVYWFNPFIWYGFHQLQKDREIACDYSVIGVIGKEQCMNYGYTLIRYAKQMKRGMFLSPISTIGGSKETIEQRIIEIADYKKDTRLKKAKSTGVILLILSLVYFGSPLFTVYASSNSSFQMTDISWQDIDLSSYFKGTDGTFVLYDLTNDRYQIYNEKLSKKRISPDSTFKIYSGLFALEENIISPDSSLQKWDKTRQPFDTWEQDQTLAAAMDNSVNWYFQDLDRQLGLPTLYSYYNKISYGNCDLTGGIDHYWAESSLKISPVEQVTLLSDLLQNKWGFEEQNIEAVKDALFLSDTSIGKLYGKTGTGLADGQNINGWFVGFLEKEDHIYCFASNLQSSEISTGSTASEITIAVLNQLLYHLEN